MSEGRALQGQGATSVERESVKVVLNGNTGVAIFSKHERLDGNDNKINRIHWCRHEVLFGVV